VCRRDVAILKNAKIGDTNEQKQITIERVRERMTPLVHPPPAVLQQSDKEIAIWTLKEFERQLEASQLAIMGARCLCVSCVCVVCVVCVCRVCFLTGPAGVQNKRGSWWASSTGGRCWVSRWEWWLAVSGPWPARTCGPTQSCASSAPATTCGSPLAESSHLSLRGLLLPRTLLPHLRTLLILPPPPRRSRPTTTRLPDQCRTNHPLAGVTKAVLNVVLVIKKQRVPLLSWVAHTRAKK
jgi:hypothetical protein